MNSKKHALLATMLMPDFTELFSHNCWRLASVCYETGSDPPAMKYLPRPVMHFLLPQFNRERAGGCTDTHIDRTNVLPIKQWWTYGPIPLPWSIHLQTVLCLFRWASEGLCVDGFLMVIMLNYSVHNFQELKHREFITSSADLGEYKEN